GQALADNEEDRQACEAYLGIFVDRDVPGSPNGNVMRHRSPSVANSFVHFYNNLPLRENTVLYESYDGTTIRSNPRAIFEQRSLYDPHDEWLHVWVINTQEAIPEDWKQYPNVVFIPRDSYRYALFQATAAY